MTNFNTTKRALFSSVIALLICFTMLLGTTFAWFTDSVTSANNIIQSGTLDVQLLMDADVNGTYDDISDSTSPIFSADTIWEPGRTQVAYLAIKNNGSLDLKYTVCLNVQNVTKNLNEVMEYAIVSEADANNKVTAWNGGESVAVGTQSVLEDKALESGDIYYFALVIHMDELAGDEYQGGEISFNLTVVATQLSDNAQYPEVDSVTVPENNTEDVVLITENIKVTVPAADAVGGDVYEIVVSNENTTTDSVTEETTVSFDVTMYKNDAKVSGDTIYTVTKYIGTGKFISKVTHNGVDMTEATTGADQTYTYDSATGVLTIYTKSFSPFEITYTNFKDYTKNKNFFYGDYIGAATGRDFLPIVAVNPQITKYSVFDGDTRITDAVTFRFSDVKKDTIDENSYSVSFDLKVLDADGNDLELKPGMPSTINGKEYLHVYVNLLEVPEGYSVSEVRVNGESFTLTNNASGTLDEGEYWIAYEAKDVYLQSMEAGLIEIILTKTN